MLGAPQPLYPTLSASKLRSSRSARPCDASYHVGQNRKRGTHVSDSLLSSRIRIRVTAKGPSQSKLYFLSRMPWQRFIDVVLCWPVNVLMTSRPARRATCTASVHTKCTCAATQE